MKTTLFCLAALLLIAGTAAAGPTASLHVQTSTPDGAGGTADHSVDVIKSEDVSVLVLIDGQPASLPSL